MTAASVRRPGSDHAFAEETAPGKRGELLVVAALLAALILVNGVNYYLGLPWIGLALCLIGMFRPQAPAIDLWVLVPLLVYDIFALLSAVHSGGNPFPRPGYFPAQILYTVFYLLMAQLSSGGRRNLRYLCTVWAGICAAGSIVQYVIMQPDSVGGRLTSSYIGGANVFGIFLVFAWFSFLDGGGWIDKVRFLEPVILCALAMTLSMGSFLSLGIGLVLTLILEHRDIGWKSAGIRFRERLARLIPAMAVGVLLYAAVQRTNAAWLIVLLAAFLVFVSMDWSAFVQFLSGSSRACWAIIAVGAALAAGAIVLRPGATATFADRIDMMKNGVAYYLGLDPLFGVGPYRWRTLNALDPDAYYNTNQIHNVFIHVGVEFGLPAMIALIVIAVRFFAKPGKVVEKAGGAAFLCHAMIDTTFFIEGVTLMGISSFSRPAVGGKAVPPALQRICFGALGAFCIWSYSSLAGGA